MVYHIKGGDPAHLDDQAGGRLIDVKRAVKHFTGRGAKKIKEPLERNNFRRGYLSFSKIKQKIHSKSPIVADWYTSIGHMMVIRGYRKNPKRVLFVDPTDGKGHKMRYKRFKKGVLRGMSYTWAGSLFWK